MKTTLTIHMATFWHLLLRYRYHEFSKVKSCNCSIILILSKGNESPAQSVTGRKKTGCLWEKTVIWTVNLHSNGFGSGVGGTLCSKLCLEKPWELWLPQESEKEQWPEQRKWIQRYLVKEKYPGQGLQGLAADYSWPRLLGMSWTLATGSGRRGGATKESSSACPSIAELHLQGKKGCHIWLYWKDWGTAVKVRTLIIRMFIHPWNVYWARQCDKHRARRCRSCTCQDDGITENNSCQSNSGHMCKK